MSEPTYEDFLERSDEWINLYPHQKKLAEALIKYRRAHFICGLRGGRTTVVDAVQKYFEECGFPRAGKEI